MWPLMHHTASAREQIIRNLQNYSHSQQQTLSNSHVQLSQQATGHPGTSVIPSPSECPPSAGVQIPHPETRHFLLWQHLVQKDHPA